MSLFRYPGGKTKICKEIIEELKLQSNNIKHYREPFFGGGSIGLEFLKTTNIENIWINDKDIGIACLWTSIINFPTELKTKILEFTPSVEKFDLFKQCLLKNIKIEESKDIIEKIVQIGFMKLVVHQLSYSGLGVKSGSALGGKKQKSKYKIDCRWSPSNICFKIDKTYKQFKKYDIQYKMCTFVDYSVLLAEEIKSVFYLDPPYFIKGNDLYQYSFTEQDHIRLCNLLKETKHNWILSYDDCSEIRNLYNWATIKTLNIKYTIKGSRNKTELLITK